jgi:hypothetical protein
MRPTGKCSERDGGFSDGRSDHVQGLARILVEVRADLGLLRDLDLSDLEHVLVTRQAGSTGAWLGSPGQSSSFSIFLFMASSWPQTHPS